MKHFVIDAPTKHFFPPSRKTIDFPPTTCSLHEKHAALFLLLESAANTTQGNTKPLALFDLQTMQDLNLFFYSPEEPEKTVLECVYNGYSLNGKIALGQHIIHASADTTLLQERQDNIKYLLQNNDFTKQLCTIFQELADLETELYSLWNKNDFLYAGYIEKIFYRSSFAQHQGLIGSLKLSLYRRINDILPLVQLLAKESEQFIVKALVSKLQLIPTAQEYKIRPSILDNIDWVKALWNKTARTKSPQEQFLQMSDLGYSLVYICIVIANTPAWLRSIKNYRHFTQYLTGRLSVLLRLQELITRINRLLSQHPSFAVPAVTAHHTIPPFLSNVARAVGNKKSYFFTNTGAIFHLLPQFLAIRHHWGPLMASLGTIEALLSTARLLQKNQPNSPNWCLAEYHESDTPQFVITQYSHPMMDTNKAVKNTISLGSLNGPKGIVITGANTAGKTMNIQSITLTLLLGQSLTVAHAQKLEYTPVHKLLTYLNSTDNISANKSLFQIEEARILAIVNQLYNLPAGSRSFVAIDELFSSAAPTAGQAAAFGICYGLSTLPLCTPIVATHFKKLTALPKHTNNFYANYHLVIPNRTTNNINTPPFILTPGASTQIIAFDLARASGFDSEIIDSAEEFLSSSRRAFTEPNND